MEEHLQLLNKAHGSWKAKNLVAVKPRQGCAELSLLCLPSLCTDLIRDPSELGSALSS